MSGEPIQGADAAERHLAGLRQAATRAAEASGCSAMVDLALMSDDVVITVTYELATWTCDVSAEEVFAAKDPERMVADKVISGCLKARAAWDPHGRATLATTRARRNAVETLRQLAAATRDAADHIDALVARVEGKER